MSLPNLDFGEKEEVGLWRVAGSLTITQALVLLQELTELLGMTPDGPPKVNHYPTDSGTGGEGIQVYQAWTESFGVIGTWPRLGIVRVYLASCKPFHPAAVTKFLELAVGRIEAFGWNEI